MTEHDKTKTTYENNDETTELQEQSDSPLRIFYEKGARIYSFLFPFRKTISGFLFICAGCFLLFFIWKWVNEPVLISPVVPESPPFQVFVEEIPPISYEEISRIFESNLMPHIEYANSENDAAKERALRTVRDNFVEFRTGIPLFTKDLTSWGTRFGVVSNWSKDKWDQWWNDNENANRLGEYVHNKFREHILSEDKLEAVFNDSITQFTADMAANRNILLSEMQIVLRSQHIPVQIRIPNEDFNDFISETQDIFYKLSSQLGSKSLGSGVVAFIAGESIAWGTTQVTLSIIPRISTMISARLSGPIISTVLTPVAASVVSHFASTGVATAGTTASLAAGGGASGTTVGPVGTIVGLSIGVIIGGLADWWMSARFEEKTAEQLNVLLTVIERQIIEGVQDEDGNTQGLDQIFSDANKEMKTLMRESTLKALWERSTV